MAGGANVDTRRVGMAEFKMVLDFAHNDTPY
jgi:hypothetical protein